MHYKPGRIFLSTPHMGGHEKNYVQKALEDNWVTTIGPNIPGFEHDICQHTNARHAVALSSGTAAMHLALRLAGVKAGDEVLCPTFNFVASANAVLYLGAIPAFVESEPATWNMCPETLRTAIVACMKKGKKPACIVLAHTYGMPASVNEVLEIAQAYGIPVVEDAAEALGSRYSGHQAGTFGVAGTFSFKGDKIVTTSGGGALITPHEEIAKQARHLAAHAREAASYYQHSEMGYDYRLSNVSAGIGRGQIEVLETRVKQRREIFNFYREKLQEFGLEFLEEPKNTFSNRWLTTALVAPEAGKTPADMIQLLEEQNIEARHLWKPMHLQPLFKDAAYFGDKYSETLFNRGICLPSSTSLTEEELDKVVQVLKRVLQLV